MLGAKGYADLAPDTELTNFRSEPSCSNKHVAEPMYLQRTENKLRWLCPICEFELPFKSVG
jgi:hypothetical protein